MARVTRSSPKVRAWTGNEWRYGREVDRPHKGRHKGSVQVALRQPYITKTGRLSSKWRFRWFKARYIVDTSKVGK